MDTITLPNGSELAVRVALTAQEGGGEIALVVISCVSLIAVVVLLAMISLSAFNTRNSLDENLFVRTNVAVYFLFILLCDMFQAAGSIMNSKWIQQMQVITGSFCVTQGVIKQFADVGAAVWTLIVAIHTFCLLFLQIQTRKLVLWAALVAGWSVIGTIVIAGPATVDTAKNGPFFAISGYWCWISPEYNAQRIILDYMIMFLAAFFSFILYSMVYLRIRGNLVVHGWRIRFRFLNATSRSSWRGRELANDRALTIAKQMLLYPVAYTVLILPIAICRLAEWTGHDVSFQVTIFSDTIYLLSGLVNVTLFLTTRRLLPPQSMRIGKWAISRPQPLVTSPIAPGSADPYYHTSQLATEKAVIDDEPKTPMFKRSESYQSDYASSEDSAFVDLPITSPPVQTVATPTTHTTVLDETRESVYSMYSGSTNSSPDTALRAPQTPTTAKVPDALTKESK